MLVIVGQTTVPNLAMSTSSSSSSETTLKRVRSIAHATPDSTASLAELPKINGEIILVVFTHRSLRPATNAAPATVGFEHSNNEILAELGKHALETAVTDALFSKKPFLKAEDIAVS